MANLWYTLNGTKIFPAINGLVRDVEPVEETLPMAAGNDRVYHRRERVRWTFTRPRADETTWGQWKAIPRNTAITLTEPDGTNYTVKVERFSDPISATKPDNPGSATATGPVWRDLTLEVRQL